MQSNVVSKSENPNAGFFVFSRDFEENYVLRIINLNKVKRQWIISGQFHFYLKVEGAWVAVYFVYHILRRIMIFVQSVAQIKLIYFFSVLIKPRQKFKYWVAYISLRSIKYQKFEEKRVYNWTNLHNTIILTLVLPYPDPT